MNASDGSEKTNLSNHPADDTRCDWGRLLECTITGAGFINGTEGDGDDTLFGDQGTDFISAGAGNDIASGSEDGDQVAGDDGADECYGEQRSACEQGAES